MDSLVKIPELSPDIGDEEVYILDAETASLQGGVVEIAWLRVNQELEVLEEFRSLCNPEREIDPRAQEIHGISYEEVKDAPTLSQIACKFSGPINLLAHNAPFDRRIISPTILVGRALCSLDLARQFIKGTSNSKLETLQRELALPAQKSHSALGDVHTVRDLMLRIMPLTGVSIKTLFERAAVPRLLATMPFGKHKGVPISKTPRDYRNWLLAQDDIGKDLRFTLTKFKDI